LTDSHNDCKDFEISGSLKMVLTQAKASRLIEIL